MSSVRAFLAIPLPLQLQDSISKIRRTLQAQRTAIRWTRPENLPLPLYFFGEIEQETLEKIKVSMLSVKDCQRPFSVEVRGLGGFPDLHRPRILWLGLEPEVQLRQLHSKCQKALQLAGVATESRPYSPHLTIGRLQRGRPDLTDLHNAADSALLGQLPIDRLVLFRSILLPGGAEHVPIMIVKFDNEISNRQEKY